MISSSTPSPEGSAPQPSGPELTGSVFRIGDESVSGDYISDAKRYLLWVPGPDDEALKDLARWGDMLPQATEGGHMAISIPESTRPLRSILGGVAAWRSEKQVPLEFVLDYTRKVQERLGGVDVSVSLDTIARTRDGGKLFITPPHSLVRDERTVIEDWKAGFVHQIRQALENSETDGQKVAEDFEKNLDGILSHIK